MEDVKIERVDPRSDSYSALLWDVVTNMHRYQPRPGDKVLDLGAHYGMFSLYCAARGADVMAFEPQKIAFHELRHTAEVAAEIGAGGILPINKAVWHHDGTVYLTRKPGASTATASAVRPNTENNATEAAECLPFDAVLQYGERWSCVKMDIEGAEFELLTNSTQLQRIAYLTVEVHNDIIGPNDAAKLRDFLTAEFRSVERLPRKDFPEQDVALFCRR